MPKKVREAYENYVEHNTWFKVLSICAIALIVASFIVPPLGIIDSSVLAAVGEIFGFAALWTLIKAIDKGKVATISHNNTTISVGKDKDGNGLDDDWENQHKEIDDWQHRQDIDNADALYD